MRAALGPLIDAEARAAGLAIAPEARSALIALLGADRQTTRGEIAKLMLYARGRPTVSAEDVEAIVVGRRAVGPRRRSSTGRSAATLAAVAALATRYFGEGGDGDLLLVRLVQRADAAASATDRNGPGKVVRRGMQALFVRLPPAAKRALARQAERWTSESLAQRLPAVRAASANVRTDPRLAESLATRTLWALASRRAR